ncbi:MAG: hypothetical protein KDK39_17380 [Leptospiraceae bacterium]|nr:hypothetical protein [Leptospiraceae bacterium]
MLRSGSLIRHCRSPLVFSFLGLVFALSELSADAQRARDLYLQSRRYLEQKQVTKALNLALQAEAEDASNGWYSANVGSLYQWHIKKPDTARLYYQKALQKGSQEPWIYRHLAILDFNAQKMGSARDQIETAVTLGQSRLETGVDQNAGPSNLKALAQDQITNLGWQCRIALEEGRYLDVIRLSSKAEQLQDRYRPFAAGRLDGTLVYSAAEALYWQGHEALSRAEYNQAATAYDQGTSWANRNASMAEWFRNQGMSELAPMARARASLGVIQPVYVHRFHALYLNEVKARFQDSSGHWINAETRITDNQISASRIMETVLQTWLEVHSKGKLSLHGEHHKMDLTVRNFKVSTSYGVESRQPDLESAGQELADFLFEYGGDVDTWFFYWNGEGFATTANGGAHVYAYVPWQLYGSMRGYVSMPSHWMEKSSGFLTLLHEYFHVVEAMSGIKPVHGFLDSARRNFPGWRGKGQFDYFRWHFYNTLPAVKNSLTQKREWSNLNFKNIYPEIVTAGLVQKNKDRVQTVAVDKLERAHLLYQQARNLPASSQNEKIGLFQQVLELNPWHIMANQELAIHYSRQKEYQLAAEHYKTLLSLQPRVWAANNLAWIYQWQLKQPASAIPVLQQAIELDREGTDSLGSRINLSRALMDTKQFAASLKALQECRTVANQLESSKHYSECTFWEGFVLGEKKADPDAARPLIAEAWQKGYQNNFSRFYYNKYVKKPASRNRALMGSAQPEVQAAPFLMSLPENEPVQVSHD